MLITRSRLLTAVLVLAPCALHAQADRAARVDSIFANVAPSTAGPGCAVGVAENGRTVLTRAYGSAELEHGIPNTPETVFEAGSVSKQFTAAAVVLLAQRGQLSLDDDVRRWLPEVPDYGHTITIRHLLNHTSGLRDWGSVQQLAGWPRGTRAYTHAHVLDIVSRQRELNYAPGAEYLYSNTGYNLLAILVERVSGSAFAEFSRREIFAPAGMRSTQWRDDYTRLVPGRAQAYEFRDGAHHLRMPFEDVHGNGGLLTTVGDLLAWNGALESGAFRALGAEMERQGVLSGGRRILYALGLKVAPYRGLREVSHSGATAGYRAYLVRYPETGVSVALLCNTAQASPVTLGHRVADLFLDDHGRDAAPPAEVALPRAQLERLAGMYRSTRTGNPVRLTMTDEGLHWDETRLVPLSPTLFDIGDDERVLVDAGAAPRPTLRFLDAEGDTVALEPVQAAAMMDSAAASQYHGEYYSADAEMAYTVGWRDGALSLGRRPGVHAALAPAYADAFTTPEGWLVRFIRGDDGRVRAITIGVGRVRALRFDRVEGGVAR